MKWRLPAEAWPASPGRKPCSASSAWRSLAASATRAGRHAHVLDDQRHARAGAAPPADPASPRARATASRSPRRRARSAAGRSAAGPSRIVSAARLGRRRARPGPRPGTRPAARPTRRQRLPALRRAGHVVRRRDQRRRDHQLGRRRPGVRRASAHGGGGGIEVLEHDQRETSCGGRAARSRTPPRPRTRACPRSRSPAGGRSPAACRRRGTRTAGSRSCS